MAEPKTLHGLGYLGKCYNIITLDPLNMGVANGAEQNEVMQKHVLDLGVGEGDTDVSPRAEYKVPKGVTVSSPYSTEATTLKSVLFNSYDFSNELKSEMSANAGVSGLFEFSGSKSAREFAKTSGSRKQAFTYATMRVRNHDVKVSLDEVSPERLNASFAKRVSGLPPQRATEPQKKEYVKFIEDFGTHFTRGVSLGGFAYSLVSKQETKLGDSSESEATFKQQASLEIKGFSAGAKAEETQKKIKQADLEHKITREALVFRGGKGTLHEIKDDWTGDLEEMPAPISLGADLQRLEVVLTPYFFPDGKDIAEKQQALKQAIDDYVVSKGLSLDDKIREGDQLSFEKPLTALPDIDGVLVWQQDPKNLKNLEFKHPGTGGISQKPTIKLMPVTPASDGLVRTGEPLRIWIEVPNGPKGYLTVGAYNVVTVPENNSGVFLAPSLLGPGQGLLRQQWKAYFIGGGGIAMDRTAVRPLVSGDRVMFVPISIGGNEFGVLGGETKDPDQLVVIRSSRDPSYSGDAWRWALTVKRTGRPV
ncbi:MAG: MAC/perforin domain-containing protein [Candidatus Korobacteraceae bacterium]|jgi:MAC/Perforin domain-containing protein